MDCSGFVGKIELIEYCELFVFLFNRGGRSASGTTLFLLRLDVICEFAESLGRRSDAIFEATQGTYGFTFPPCIGL
jgi:hypothetical protein